MNRISVRYRTLSLIKAIFKDLIGNSPLCSNDTCVVMEKSGAIIRLKTVLNSQEPKYLGLRTETIYREIPRSHFLYTLSTSILENYKIFETRNN